MAVNLGDTVRPYHIREMINDVFVDDSGYVSELESMLDDYMTVLNAVRSFPCPKCGGEGRHAESVDTGEVGDTELVHCQMTTVDGAEYCDGWGYTENEVKINKPFEPPTFIGVA